MIGGTMVVFAKYNDIKSIPTAPAKHPTKTVSQFNFRKRTPAKKRPSAMELGRMLVHIVARLSENMQHLCVESRQPVHRALFYQHIKKCTHNKRDYQRQKDKLEHI